MNRTVQVAEDGSWLLENVPSFMGRVRARASCVNEGETATGQSDYFIVETNQSTKVSEIKFGDSEKVPVELYLTDTLPKTLTQNELEYQLKVFVEYPDGSFSEVTDATSGINYASSNNNIVNVTADGLVTAVNSGNALISARLNGLITIKTINVSLSGDMDGDGIPDDFERANGLDPNDPIDAAEDQDRDGLSALEEFTKGTDVNVDDTDADGIKDGEETIAGEDGFITNPLLADTDGDGLNDGLEILIASDPTDSTSGSLADALDSISVSPPTLVMTFNLIDTEVSEQLTVTGHMIDGSTLDITSKSTGTEYTSSDLNIVSFGLTDGEIFGGLSGSATVTVSNNGFSEVVSVTVENFGATALSATNVPGTTNNVDTSGNYAYVVGSAGLSIIDISDKAQPSVVTTLNTGATVQDVKVFGSLAYLASSASGLQIVDISNPLSPSIISSRTTAGSARDIRVDSQYAYIAIGTGGLEIINIEDPFNPATTATLGILGDAKGVDIDGNLALVVAGSKLHAINIQNKFSPSVISSIEVGSVRDVVASEGYAYIAAHTSGFKVVDYGSPMSLIEVGGTTDFFPNNVELAEGLAFFSEIFFVNGAPFVNNQDPENATYSGFVDFSSFGDDNGRGIAVDSSYVYLVTDKNRLLIAQYRQLQDNQGIAPTVTLNKPTQATKILQGSNILIDASAEDDVAVSFVTYLIDDVEVGVDSSRPYQLPYRVPGGTNSIKIGVRATDFAGNSSIAEAVFSVEADSDGDGLSDSDETNVYFTDPNDIDTDGDGMTDGTEVAAGTDPNDPQDFIQDYSQLVLRNNPVAFWKFDEAAGATTAIDSSGNGHHVNYPANTTFGIESYGPSGTAVETNNDYNAINVAGDITDFQLTTQATIELWVRYDGQGTWQSLIAQGYDTSWAIKRTNGIGWDIHYENAGRRGRSCSAFLHEWTHCVYTFDGQFERVYRNGIMISEADLGSDSIVTSNVPVHLGPHPSGGSWQTVNYPFDDVAIYKTALSAEEIKLHHFTGRNGGRRVSEGLKNLVVYADSYDETKLARLGLEVNEFSTGVYLVNGSLVTFPKLFVQATGAPTAIDLYTALDDFFVSPTKMESVGQPLHYAYVAGQDWHAGGGPSGFIHHTGTEKFPTYIIYDPFIWPGPSCCFYHPNWVRDKTNDEYIFNNYEGGDRIDVNGTGAKYARATRLFFEDTQEIDFYMNYGLIRMSALSYEAPFTLSISGGENRTTLQGTIPVSTLVE